MKRELKQLAGPYGLRKVGSIAEPIPMKRELKLEDDELDKISKNIAEPIPMKRELKLQPTLLWCSVAIACIAEPIPMKRELKLLLQ